MKRSTLSHSFLNIVLVFFESALTLVLRLDPNLRKAAYPLAKDNTVVCLRLYLPHIQIFATFSYKGVLLDADLPENRHEPDVIINAYTMQLINAMTKHDAQATEKLQMRGENSRVQLVKHFIMQLGLGGLIQSLIKRFKGGKDSARPDVTEAQQKTDNYKLRISEQQTQINALTIKNRELETTNKELESKQKVVMIAMIVAIVIALIALGALIIS